ncbi:MAG: EscE/YscE/SsaE family type III secretion system needle protein co-chaperone [Burkholderiaceae bacterium]|nr:EscE/YscE/SsaE family type III secretion system needle protein co-chaperone [Burkholderiaceae bacterium]
MNTSDRFMSELEEQLVGPDGAAKRKEVQGDLEKLEMRLSSRIAAMVPPQEYRALASSLEAVRAARHVMSR